MAYFGPEKEKTTFCGGFSKVEIGKNIGGDERIRTSDQSFSPDAPLAGECLRPARPRLRTSYYYNDPQFNG